jgi:hypothetical protein
MPTGFRSVVACYLDGLAPGHKGQKRVDEEQDGKENRQTMQYDFNATARAKSAAIAAAATQKSTQVLAFGL